MRGTLERLAALGLEALEASVKDGEAVFRAEPEGVEERLPREALEKALGFLEEEALAFLEELASAEGEVEARLDLKRGELRVRWRTFQEEEWSLGKEAWRLPLRLSLEARREGEAKGRGLATKGKLLDFEGPEDLRPLLEEALDALEEHLEEAVFRREKEDLEVLGLETWRFPFRYVLSGRCLSLEGRAEARVWTKRYLAFGGEVAGEEVFSLEDYLEERALERLAEV